MVFTAAGANLSKLGGILWRWRWCNNHSRSYPGPFVSMTLFNLLSLLLKLGSHILDMPVEASKEFLDQLSIL